jgi:hypothetical protein
MIQRIQTVYLILGAAALIGLLFFDSLWSAQAASSYGWYLPAVAGVAGVTVLTSVTAVFLYTQRKTQRKVVVGAQLLTVVLAAALYGGLYLTDELAVRTAGAFNWSKGAMLGLPIVAYLFFLLARRGIDHDIELVESMDRLR